MCTLYKLAHCYQSIYYENRQSAQIYLFTENRSKQPSFPYFSKRIFALKTGSIVHI